MATDAQPSSISNDLNTPAVLAVSASVERLIEQRAEARRRGDVAGADRVRDSLERRGIELRDTATEPSGKVRAATRTPAPDEP